MKEGPVGKDLREEKESLFKEWACMILIQAKCYFTQKLEEDQ